MKVLENSLDEQSAKRAQMRLGDFIFWEELLRSSLDCDSHRLRGGVFVFTSIYTVYSVRDISVL